MEEKIYQALRSHKLPLKKREELMPDLLALFSVSKRLNEDTLEEINNVMWESYMIKDRNFGRQEGFKIMQELEKWANR